MRPSAWHQKLGRVVSSAAADHKTCTANITWNAQYDAARNSQVQVQSLGRKNKTSAAGAKTQVAISKMELKRSLHTAEGVKFKVPYTGSFHKNIIIKYLVWFQKLFLNDSTNHTIVDFKRFVLN